MSIGFSQEGHGPRYVLCFTALCALSALSVIGLDNWSAAEFHIRSWFELFYNARIALCVGLFVGVLHGGAFLLERRLFARAPWAVGALLLLTTSSIVFEAASELSRGEGVAARGISHGVALTLAMGLLYTFIAVTWWVARPTVPARLQVPLATALLVLLGICEQRFLRTYGMLAPFFIVGLTLLLTSLVYRLCARSAWAVYGVSAFSAITFFALIVAGLARPGWMASGRLSVLADESLALHVDPLLFAEEGAAVRFDLSLAPTFACDERTQPIEPWPSLALPKEARRNVVLISIDSLRRDRLHRERDKMPLMPNLRRFAQEARVAEKAVTSYPATLFALGSAMTGLWPSEMLFAPEPPDTLFKLTARELRTQRAILPNSKWFLQPALFRYVAQDVSRKAVHGARAQTDAALDFLRESRRLGRRHLLWVHYFEPHAPYESHDDFAFGSSAVDRYDSEVAQLDRELGRLFELLRTGGWYQDSLIMLFSDHGEALGERNYYGHHVFLQHFISDIPLVVRAPGEEPGIIRAPVSIADVAPTVLHYLDVAPKTRLSGQSLLGEGPAQNRSVLSEAFPLRGTELFGFAERPVTSVEALAERVERIQSRDHRYHPKVALVRNGRRLIVRRTTGTTELYALDDEREAHDLTPHEPHVVRAMMQELGRWHRQASERFYCDILAKSREHPGEMGASATLDHE